MRTYLVAALVIAIVACLSLGVSAGGYGHTQTYRPYVPPRPPVYGYRYYRMPYLLSPGSAGYGGGVYASGFNYGGYRPGGFNWIWLILGLIVLLALLNDK